MHDVYLYVYLDSTLSERTACITEEPDHIDIYIRPLVKSAYQKIIFLFLKQNMLFIRTVSMRHRLNLTGNLRKYLQLYAGFFLFI